MSSTMQACHAVRGKSHFQYLWRGLHPIKMHKISTRSAIRVNIDHNILAAWFKWIIFSAIARKLASYDLGSYPPPCRQGPRPRTKRGHPYTWRRWLGMRLYGVRVRFGEGSTSGQDCFVGKYGDGEPNAPTCPRWRWSCAVIETSQRVSRFSSSSPFSLSTTYLISNLRGSPVNWMSMRINSLFEHDASMKRQAENAGNVMTSSNSFINTMAEVQHPSPSDHSVSTSNKNSTKPAAARHRASIACASCRDRRIRVCGQSLVSRANLTNWSVLYHQESEIARNANARKQNVSLGMTTSDDGESETPLFQNQANSSGRFPRLICPP
jgi:hypothetical protein